MATATKKTTTKTKAKTTSKTSSPKQVDRKKVEEILSVFEEISKIPRCSGNEVQIGQWLLDWASAQQLEARRDPVGNVLIKVPASKGYEKSKTVVIQGHQDMVCQKVPDSSHDFSKDPLELVSDGEWLSASGTTLGADNGIAVALAVVFAKDKSVKHPPLELLFTVQEEVGLAGVEGLQPDFIEGEILLNLDSEEEGEFTIGCAGGQNSNLALPLECIEVPGYHRPYKLVAGGMKGGHSGTDINAQRANAIKVLCRVLNAMMAEDDIRVAFIAGGTLHNAIPRDAEAIVFVPEHRIEHHRQLVATQEKTLKDEYKQTDPKLKLSFEPCQVQDNRAILPGCGKRAIDFLLALPHGVAAMSTEIEGLVETSNNLAIVKVEEGKLKVTSSQRSSVMSRLKAHTNCIEAVARLAGAEAYSSEGYPAWEANWDSPLVALCKQVYQKTFRTEPEIKVIHAGLECGQIGDKYPGMEMVSFGPTIRDAHSPTERLHIESIGKVWIFTTELLKALK